MTYANKIWKDLKPLGYFTEDQNKYIDEYVKLIIKNSLLLLKIKKINENKRYKLSQRNLQIELVEFDIVEF